MWWWSWQKSFASFTWSGNSRIWAASSCFQAASWHRGLVTIRALSGFLQLNLLGICCLQQHGLPYQKAFIIVVLTKKGSLCCGWMVFVLHLQLPLRERLKHHPVSLYKLCSSQNFSMCLSIQSRQPFSLTSSLSFCSRSQYWLHRVPLLACR